jgi:hypothetical protein
MYPPEEPELSVAAGDVDAGVGLVLNGCTREELAVGVALLGNPFFWLLERLKNGLERAVANRLVLDWRLPMPGRLLDELSCCEGGDSRFVAEEFRAIWGCELWGDASGDGPCLGV